MRGKPFIQWLVFSAFWLLLLIPISRIAGSSAVSREETIRRPSEKIPVWLTVRFSTPPQSLSVYQENALVWEEENPDGRVFERQVELLKDAFGLEIRLVAKLSDEESAVEVSVEPDGLPRRFRTLWVEGPVDDPFRFSWGRNE
ncbi:MAG TPA: hypothetical protein PJ991_06380 [Kiritimatiellia bacterium]|mgnify:CR=1 FL=1|nr:hypothetical protein [Kiritimatiellia bacterium]